MIKYLETAWIQGNPTQVGVYKRRSIHEPITVNNAMYAYWDGQLWGWRADTAKKAEKLYKDGYQLHLMQIQNFYAGLVENPND